MAKTATRWDEHSSSQASQPRFARSFLCRRQLANAFHEKEWISQSYYHLRRQPGKFGTHFDIGCSFDLLWSLIDRRSSIVTWLVSWALGRSCYPSDSTTFSSLQVELEWRYRDPFHHCGCCDVVWYWRYDKIWVFLYGVFSSTTFLNFSQLTFLVVNCSLHRNLNSVGGTLPSPSHAILLPQDL